MFRSNTYGFGYEIWTIEFRERMCFGEMITATDWVERVFITADEGQLTDIYESFKNGKMTLEDLKTRKPDLRFTPQLLALELKYGTFHYQVNSEAGYMKASLSIVKQRNKEGRYSDVLKQLKDQLESLGDLTPEAIEALPKSLQHEAKRQAEEAVQAKGELEKVLRRQMLLKQALKGDGAAAIKVLLEFNSDNNCNIKLTKFQGIY